MRNHVGAANQFSANIDPYVIPGNSSSGFVKGVWPDAYGAVGDASPYVMAFNYRLCLTNVGSMRIPFTEPANYDPADYELYARYLQTDGASWLWFSDTLLANTLQGDGANYRIDANSRRAISTNFVDPVCTEYITATSERRAEIREEIKNWMLGLFWFLKTDDRVPASVKTDAANWGFVKDEFQEYGGFSPELYVREGRRLIGDWVMKEPDLNVATAYTDGVAFTFYPADSHHCRRVYIPGVGVRNEGSSAGGAFFAPIAGNSIPIRVMWPKVAECTNLQATFAVSATHVAFSSLRMEPTSMSLGEAAGVAAAISAKNGTTVQDVSVADVQKAIDFRGGLDVGHGAIVSADGTTYTQGTATASGAWSTGSPIIGYLGCAHKASSTAGSYIDFAPNIKRTGKYRVLLNWQDPGLGVRGTAVPVTITHAGWTTSITVNQLADGSGGNWLDVGDFVFQAGTPSTHKVRVAVQAEGTSTVIAAVKFIQV